MRADPSGRVKLSDERNPVRSSKGGAAFALLGGIIAAGAAGATWAAFHFLSGSHSFSLPSDVIQQLDSEERPVVARLMRDPCNRDATSDVADALEKHDEYSVIIDLYETRIKECGVADEIFPQLYAAQMGLSKWDDAEKTTDRIISTEPDSPEGYGWRSVAREHSGKLPGALSDSLKFLARTPDLSAVDLNSYYDTARLAAQTGHPCDAVSIMRDYLSFDPTERRTHQVETFINGWQVSGACAAANGVGSATMRYNRTANEIVVPVQVNGISGRFIVDTGATFTTLTSEFARRLAVKPSDELGGTVTTLNGEVFDVGGRVESVTVGGATLNNVHVLIQSPDAPLGDGIDGLLGRSFLENFDVEIGGGNFILRPISSSAATHRVLADPK